MSEPAIALSRRTFTGAAVVSAIAALAFPASAFGTTAAEKQAEADAVRNQLIGLQAELETAEGNYHLALTEQEAAQEAMAAEQVKIDETSAQIASLQERLGARARGMYRTGSATFFDFVLGAASFAEFTQNWDILNRVNESDAALVAETKTLREELEASKEEYAKQEGIAAAKAEEAKAVQEEHAAKVAQASALMESLDAEARELLEQEQAAAAAAAAAQREAEEQAAREREAQNAPTGGNGGGDTPDVPTGNGVEVPSQGSVVSYAMSRIGCPYILGAAGPDAFDCSGLVCWAYAQVGVSLPHYTEDLRAVARQVVSVAEARPGDVLYRPGHVGIAVGSGGVPYVHAPTPGAYVRDTDSIGWSEFTCALRF
ncbi:C40 family peptidase [Arabiibacter massiliensis]|uniref:C40 family peptidase n=1 Tax=Arabiibacter massiliensis TaxID=1870985 RepID=UPI0009BC1AB3|nr:C40 family peptidase [Arabiibacter massiliensis]